MSWPVWVKRVGIHTGSEECIGVEIGALSGGSTPASIAYPAANDAIFIPLYLQQNILVTRLFCLNGATASGNVDVGIYAEDATKIISSGSTAQAGTNAPQFFNIADTPLAPGRYYLAVAKDDTTGTLFRLNLSVGTQQCMGVAKQATAFALPATATLVAVTATYVPLIGLEMSPMI